MRALACALLLVCFAGCVSRPPVPELPAGALDFALNGKILVKMPDERHSARIRWSQAREYSLIELWGPLGQGRHILEGDSSWLVIRRPDGELLAEGPAEQVMMDLLGWSVPLDWLRYWVQGDPVPGVPIEAQEGEPGRALMLQQAGWSLEFTGHIREGNTFRPGRITAVRDGAGTEIRLVIAAWTAVSSVPVSPGGV